MRQAVILAGGKGTRLASVSGGLPKPLVPIDGTPVIQRQILLLARYGIEEIFVTTSYKAEMLNEQLGDGSRWNLKLHYVHEADPLGTAGGVAALRAELAGDFFVLYGDVMVNMDLSHLMSFHQRRRAMATIVVHPNDHPYDSDLVECDESGRISGFFPYPRDVSVGDLPNLVSAALYVLSRECLFHIEPMVQQDFVRDVFPRLLREDSPLFAYRTTEYLKDMGTPERLTKVDADVRSGRVVSMHADHRRATLFLDRDGVINEEVDGVLRPDDLKLIPEAAAAIARMNRAGWLVAGVTNQPAIAKGFMTEKDLSDVHLRLQSLLGQSGAWLDTLAHCPHHPDRGFPGELEEMKVACQCRKPNIGMLERVAVEIPVDRQNSVMVGDSWRDIVAAHRFGIDAIGVRTGNGLAAAPPVEMLRWARPDAVVDHIADAVSLLLDINPALEEMVAEIVMRAKNVIAPITILLSGLSRSGKSVAAYQLKRELGRRNLPSQVVHLDDWLVPASSRTPTCTVAERYCLDLAETAIRSLVSGRPASAPGYNERSREAPLEPITYEPIAESSVLIVEGVPAHLLKLPFKTIKGYVEVPEVLRRERLLHFYCFKGMSSEQAEALLADRREEAETVIAAGKDAEFVLRST